MCVKMYAVEQRDRGHLRELVPHAEWSAIEWGWDLVKVVIIAALGGVYQWFRGHWDIVSLCLVAAGGFALLIWNDVFRNRSNTRHGVTGAEVMVFDLRSQLHEKDQKISELTKQIEAVRSIDVQPPQTAAEAKVGLPANTNPAYAEIFKVQSMQADPVFTSDDIHFKNKLRMNLQNITRKTLYVWVPLWESSLVQSQDDPPGSRILVERTEGSWNRRLAEGKWVTQKDGKNCEFCYITLKPGITFNCYIGLAPPFTDTVDGLLKRHGTIGTILLPIKMDGRLYEVRVPAREV